MNVADGTTNGTYYKYVKTIIESEYAWRNDGYQKPTYQEAVHISPTYSDINNDKYRSIPEVLGEFKIIMEVGYRKMERFCAIHSCHSMCTTYTNRFMLI